MQKGSGAVLLGLPRSFVPREVVPLGVPILLNVRSPLFQLEG